LADHLLTPALIRIAPRARRSNDPIAKHSFA
jgi:hypothetical protein